MGKMCTAGASAHVMCAKTRPVPRLWVHRRGQRTGYVCKGGASTGASTGVTHRRERGAWDVLYPHHVCVERAGPSRQAYNTDVAAAAVY